MIYFLAASAKPNATPKFFAAPNDALYVKVEEAVRKRVPDVDHIEFIEGNPVGEVVSVLSYREVCTA